MLGMEMVLVLALMTASPAEEQGHPCRGVKEPNLTHMERVLRVERGDHATLDFPEVGAGTLLALQGRLCGPAGEPLAGVEITLKRYRETAETAKAAPTASDLELDARRYRVVSHRTSTTTADGGFRFLAVPAGEVALQVNWAGFADSVPFVVFDLTWTDGLAMESGLGAP